ncbi:MAG: polysaccharide deacetylase family protein, partial [Firmicutes bacterium]|nr:polysaccharide deacetylase family protein [Bacillota bacterium]
MPLSSIKRSCRALCFTLFTLCPLILSVWAPHAAPPHAAPASGMAQHGCTVYLTFDDGPSRNTTRVLDILHKEQVPATFFVVGTASEHGMALYNRILEEGHSLGLHTYSHNVGRIYGSLSGFTEDFTKLAQWLLETTGLIPKI